MLPEFKTKFEDKSVKAEDALTWLAQQAGSRDAVALLYAHPSRGGADPAEKLSDFPRWQAAQGLFAGFEGGPGHQKLPSPGDYQSQLKTIARWDPVVAEIGGTWDRLLDAGHSTWAALAVSDYHHPDKDFPPCSFARTHLRVPQPDYRGVLLALRAGSFWADHGHILEDLAFVAVHESLPMPATPGETIALAPSRTPRFPGEDRARTGQREPSGDGRTDRQPAAAARRRFWPSANSSRPRTYSTGPPSPWCPARTRRAPTCVRA